jgi:RecB family exonuclease
MGSWVHELLMYYRDGQNWLAHHRKREAKFNSYFEEEREALGHDMPDQCLRLVRSYIRQYGKSDKRSYTVIDTEMDEIITLPNGLEVNVIIDLIVEDRKGGIWGWDYKTRTKFDAKDLILLDPQYSLYYDAMEYMGYGPLRGFVVDEIRKKAPTVPKLLKGGGLSQAKNIDTDVWTYMAAIREQGENPDNYATILQHIATNQRERFYRRTYVPKDPPVLKRVRGELISSAKGIKRATNDKGYVYTRSVEDSCVWMCDYRDLCIIDLHGGDTSLMKKKLFTTREMKDV